jgi:hypothetical protein
MSWSCYRIFFESACIFFKRFYICKALLFFFKSLLYLQSAFIIFHSAFISAKRFYYFSNRFYICKALSLFFKACESAPIYFLWLWVSAIYFLFPKHYSALALISGCKAHNFLIMLLIIFYILKSFNISINYVQNF